MLLSKEVEISLNSRNLKYYENKGYSIPKKQVRKNKWTITKGMKIKVKIEDLQETSTAKIELSCDYCGNPIKREYRNYIRFKNGKDCCKECQGKKLIESNQLKYGVNSTAQLKEVRNKTIKSTKNSYEKIINEYRNKNCKLISDMSTYENQYSNMKFICNKHSNVVQESSFISFKSSKYGCKFCASEESIKSTLETKKIKREYKNKIKNEEKQVLRNKKKKQLEINKANNNKKWQNYRISKRYNEKYNIKFIIFTDIDILQWWKYTYYGTPNGKILSTIPVPLFNEKNIRTICKYVLENELKYKNRKDFLNLNSTIMHKYKISFHHFDKIQSSPIKLLRFCYPNYNFHEFELKRTSGNYYKDNRNKIEAIDYVINKYNIKLEDILNNNFDLNCNPIISSIYGKYFKNYYKFWKWYYKEKGIIIKDLDFKIKPNKFWEDENNRNEALKDLILNKLKIKNLQKDIPKYINGVYLKIEHAGLVNICNKYYGTTNFYKWCSNIFPQYKNIWNEEDFGKIFIAFDGVRCNSIQERIIYEFIKNNYNKYIKSIGMSRKHKYIFTLLNDNDYGKICPDFVIEYIDKNNKKLKLNKPIIIEYYGLFTKNYGNSKMLKSYYDKTLRKNKYYKSNKDIYFIDLYPKDLRNNFQGVREKLTSFIMLNFNIDINNNKKIKEGEMI